MASNLTKPEIVNNVLVNKIKNLKPSFEDQLKVKLLNHPGVTSIVACLAIIRQLYIPATCLPKTSVQYWVARGWTNSEAYVKAKENKQKNCKSAFSREFWTSRTNPKTGVSYTEHEADFERNSRRPIRKEYWIKKGYNEVDATQLAKETKSQNNKKGANQSSNTEVRRVTSKRCMEYYTARGWSDSEAIEMVSKGQRFFSKEICVEKHGEEKGIEIWQNRQNKWQEKLKAKPAEELARINRLKISKGLSVSSAEKHIASKLREKFAVATQYTLFESDKKQYVYDIVYNNRIVEYHGDFWHCNPKKYQADYINPRTKITAADKWARDQEKIKFAEAQGYQVLVVWESDFKNNKEEVIKQCTQFLTQ